MARRRLRVAGSLQRERDLERFALAAGERQLTRVGLAIRGDLTLELAREACGLQGQRKLQTFE